LVPGNEHEIAGADRRRERDALLLEVLADAGDVNDLLLHPDLLVTG
jgi:hypothetical protein